MSREIIAVDTETTGLDFRAGVRPFYISTVTEEGRSRDWRFRVSPITREVQVSSTTKNEIKRYLRGKSLLFHNVKFDLNALASIGIYFYFEEFKWSMHPDWRSNKAIEFVTCPRFDDTLIASHLINSSESHGLKDLALKYFDYSDSDEYLLKEKVTKASNIARDLGWNLCYNEKGKRVTEADYWIPAQIDPDDNALEEYASADVDRTMLLWKAYQEILDTKNYRELYEKEIRLVPVIYDLENTGMTFSKSFCNSKLDELDDKIARCAIKCRRNVYHLMGKEVNTNSPKQLKEVLHDKLGIPIKFKTKKGNPSTAKESLLSYLSETEEGSVAERFLLNLLSGRTYKSGTSYLESYLAKSYVHDKEYLKLYPGLNQTGTRTTRFSSSNPNGQNIGKISEVELGGRSITGPRLRDIFGPSKGKVWYAMDYSQLELRIFAGASKEQSMIDALDAGHDFHSFVATRITGKKLEDITSQERRSAKGVNFALIFGAGEKKVDATAGMVGAYKLFAGQFTNVASYMKKIISQGKKLGYVSTLYGYPLTVTSGKEYTGVNYVVQGTAGGLIKNAMLAINALPWFDWKQIRIVMQIHDELIFEIDKDSEYNQPQYLAQLKACLEDASKPIGISTPATCSIIEKDWGHPIDYDLGELVNG